MSVAEGAGLQESLADACSAIGTMYNTMVSKKTIPQNLLEVAFSFFYRETMIKL